MLVKQKPPPFLSIARARARRAAVLRERCTGTDAAPVRVAPHVPVVTHSRVIALMRRDRAR